MTETLDTIKFTPEKSKQIALARLDLIQKDSIYHLKARKSKALLIQLNKFAKYVNIYTVSNQKRCL